jgi:SRSO17 transposase
MSVVAGFILVVGEELGLDQFEGRSWHGLHRTHCGA